MLAGNQLRAALDAALLRESAKLNEPDMRWDEREQQHIDAACRAADAVETLDRMISEEQSASEPRGSMVVKYLAERRLQDDKTAEHLRYLQLDEFAPMKSPQHVAAGKARWTSVARGRKGTA